MARILVNADAGVPSGFGTVTANVFERLARDYGHDVHVLAVNWRGDHVDTPLKLYLPTQKIPTDIYGQSRYLDLVGQLMPDVLVFINDPAVILNALLYNPWDTERALWRGVTSTSTQTTYKPPILAYMPIDGYDSPKVWDTLADRVTRIAMSEFGRTAMPEAPVIWHGVDSQIFRPRDKKDAKRALGFDPDRFLVLRVDKNSYRKNYPDTWRALRPLLRKYGDIDVHFHCLPVAPDGYNLRSFTWNDEDIRDRVTYSPALTGFTGWDIEHLATLYAAADVFVSTSWGEGFGLTILEAMAAGTPVVASDCSSITEVVGPGGILVPPARRIAVPMGQDQCLPDIDGFTAAIERLYLAGGVRRKLGAAAVEHASSFSWDVAAAKFDEQIRKALTS